MSPHGVLPQEQSGAFVEPDVLPSLADGFPFCPGSPLMPPVARREMGLRAFFLRAPCCPLLQGRFSFFFLQYCIVLITIRILFFSLPFRLSLRFVSLPMETRCDIHDKSFLWSLGFFQQSRDLLSFRKGFSVRRFVSLAASFLQRTQCLPMELAEHSL